MHVHRILHENGGMPASITVIDGGSNSYTISRGETVFIGGPGHITSKLLHSIVFRSLTVSDGIVLWIDGGNAFDPYRMSELAERCGYDTAALLSRIRIARAFTAHQMEAIAHSAPKEALSHRISAIIVSSVAELFTGDVGWREGMDLMQSAVKNIGRMTRELGTWTLMTSGVSVSSSTEMERIADENYTRVINVGVEDDYLCAESDGLVLTVNKWSGQMHQRSLLEFAGRDE